VVPVVKPTLYIIEALKNLQTRKTPHNSHPQIPKTKKDEIIFKYKTHVNKELRKNEKIS